jgi:hypothetical protein
MDVFGLHNQVISEYAAYTRSFIRIADPRVKDEVDRQIQNGLLWPHPLIQLNPSFAPGGNIDELIREQVLHPECDRIFRIKQNDNDSGRPPHSGLALGMALSMSGIVPLDPCRVGPAHLPRPPPHAQIIGADADQASLAQILPRPLAPATWAVA